jgi:predicted glycosyltransferase
MARVWVDVTNTAHVVVLRPLVERLEAAGHEVEITARPLSHTVELLEDWGHPFTQIGFHGGASRVGKARAAARRVPAMVRFGRSRGPFAASLAHGSTDLPIASRLLRVPMATMFDYEWATLQRTLDGRVPNRVLAPDAIPVSRLRRYGMRSPRLVLYPGLKEDYALAGFTPDAGVLDGLGVDRSLPLAVVRTAPSYALYLAGSHGELTRRLLERLGARDDVATVVLPRNAEQADEVAALGSRLIVPRRAVDGRSLVALADVLVSAGGSMNREAATLGTPVWTVFEGRMGAIDEMLLREGRLRVLRDPDEVELVRKPPFVAPFAGRDPGELLELALGGWLS